MASCPWLKLTTHGSLSQLLKRLGISYKRGRDYVHSPDPDYLNKLNLIEQMKQRAIDQPQRYVFLYLDQLTYYRQPTLAQAYEEIGEKQPLAQRSYRSNTSFRVIGALNGISGRLSYLQRSRTNIACLTHFWDLVCLDYPEAEVVYIVVDNWPVHFHPKVLASLQKQNFPFPPKLPASWAGLAPSTAASDKNLPIQLLCLPTYASWLNPIEKLWRWLKQNVLHLHRASDDWQGLRDRVSLFLDQFVDGSQDLLRYTGLLPT